MRKKSLLETNPYLKDPELREALLKRSVASSCAIESDHIKIPKLTQKLIKKMREIAAEQEALKKNNQ